MRVTLSSDASTIPKAASTWCVSSNFISSYGTRNLCSRGPRGLKFFMHSHPLMGGRPPKFQQKIRRKKNFFRLISPTHYPAHNSCSKGPRGLKFVMRIDHPHVGPTTTFLFQNSTKIVHFFNFFKKKLKKILFIPLTAFPYNFCSKGPSGLKFVMRIDHPHAGPTITFWF